MTITIFKKTGELTYNGEWDGDDVESFEIDIPSEEVHEDIAQIVFDEYFKDGVKVGLPKGYNNVKEQMLKRIKCLLGDLDIWDKAEELFIEELQEKYQKEIQF